MTSSENEVNWRTEYLVLLAEHEAFLNRYMNMRKQNAELMRIIAQHEQMNEEEKKDQT